MWIFQFHEIQNAYFGQETFTLYTAADKDSGLKVFSLAVVSNKTVHECSIAFTCNVILLNIVRKHIPNLHTVFLWSDGCSSQFQSKYTFEILIDFPTNWKITLDYSEDHHFKGLHDGVGWTVKRKVYQDVSIVCTPPFS